ncbi:TRAP transporter small permease [Hwanghaeella grinnelliae]|uniref:TRAP transporter small permease protein n=1 Tax=Hwanghaeella grinnelliae TaxID=2500179 RepID=A0A3S2WU52_9PROT|nr:TRAP transporter small permease [Hwanghaeella grinnelliae]RVU38537.1 TRAP transporter small permease [Hwanghaeella grinnelliae]
MSDRQQSTFGQRIDAIEETIIAVLLGLMTLLTFCNVIARYLFNSNILWALEVTVFLFAWLVLIGVSYCVKKNLHLGVDVLVGMVPQPTRRFVTLAAALICLVFSLLLLKGSWDYWYPFATTRAFLETEDVPMPEFLQFLADVLNEGERYEKMPRFIPYFALPLGMALLTWRFVQATWRILMGDTSLIIASHEVEDADIDAAASANKEG